MEKAYKILKLLIWILCFAVVLVGVWTIYNNRSVQADISVTQTEPIQTNAEKTANTAPDFTVYDLEGNPHKLSDFVGKPVILNFWASWCGPCRSEMPEFQNFYDSLGNQIHFMMVNLTDGRQETVQSASDYITDGGYTFPVYFDSNLEAVYQYAVQAVPVTYFIDAEGNLAAYAQGALSAERLQQGIDSILK